MTTTPRTGSAINPAWAANLRGPNNRPLCKRCLGEVPKGRRTWCGNTCVADHAAKSSQTGFRWAVHRRDHGVCALCGVDCEKLDRIRGHAVTAGHEKYWLMDKKKALRRAAKSRKTEEFMSKWLRGLGYNTDISLWQADHIKPLSEGGKHELSNGQTLCYPCHRKETKDMHYRNSKKGRAEAALKDNS